MLRPLAVGLSLLLGICGRDWGALQLLSMRIENRIETVAAVNLRIEEARQTLARLKETTWGIARREINSERYVVLPAGSVIGWTVDTRPAVKLSSE